MKESIRPSQSYIDENRSKALLEKWSPVLDYSSDKVAVIEDDHTRLNTAILLENQEQWCLKEAAPTLPGQAGATGSFGQGSDLGGGSSSDSYASGDARLPKILIPMIRRTFPELITNEIVGVQPMSGPVGLAFALRYYYEAEALGASQGGVADGSLSDGTNAGPTFNQAFADTKEAGYQFLDTRFTGTSSSRLSGNSTDLDPIAIDQGVAELLGSYELTSKIPQMVVKFEKTAVEAGTRRLAARWTVELEQDLKNMNGIDVDTELTNAMSYELQAEIDREMLIRMIQVALTAGSGTGYSVWHAASADGRWMAERNRDLYQKLIVEANRVAVRNRRGAANFVVATPRVCAILEMLPEFNGMPVNGSVNTQPVGIAKVGNLGGRFNVYRDTRTEAQFYNSNRSTRVEYALLGYKGPEFYDTGIIYCPYIPVMVQRTIGPNDFSPRVGMLTRYGVVDHIFGANLYYHVVIVNGLGTAFTPGNQSVYM
jgi:hypothetical protein|tara:strand:+ start:3657 stop:5108 length:1452 start_codon:yes stop_codon:yes gene_type:complete